MAYKLKPNYHFANTSATGIDKVPVGRLIVVEDYGNYNEIKWLRKISNSLHDSNGNVIGTLNGTHTINDALTYLCLNSPFDTKRDIASSYSKDEVDSMLSVKAASADVYTKTVVDQTFRKLIDSYTSTEVDALIDGIRKNDTGIYQHANTINQSFTINDLHNGFSIGPVTLGDNVQITIPDGSCWEII